MNGVSVVQAATSCACSDPDCRSNGCQTVRKMLAAQRGCAPPWPVMRHPEAPAMGPDHWSRLAPPELGCRYRIDRDGTIFYERDPSFVSAAGVAA